MIRVITTAQSVWVFDMGNMLYIRLLRSDAPTDLQSPEHSGSWEPFTEIEPTVNNTVIVHRPVPLGFGAIRETGNIIEDTGDTRQ